MPDEVQGRFNDWLDRARHKLAHSAGDVKVTAAVLDPALAASMIPVGGIVPYYGAAAPTNWLLCDGASFSAVTYPALAALLGGTTTPNLKGKVIVGRDAAQTEFDTLGETGGAKTVAAEVPAHNHTTPAHGHANATGGESAHFHSFSVNSGGQSANHTHNTQLEFTGNLSHHHAAGINRPAEGPTGGGGGVVHTLSGTSVDHFHGVSGNVNGGSNHAHSITDQAAGTTGTVTAGTPHNNLQPYSAIPYIIRAI